MFSIDPKDPTPLYAQLRREILVAVATGELRPGDQLPTVRQLAVELRVNANTVAKVYGELERAGALETRRGVGTFVSDTPGRAAPREERERQLAQLVDRFLGDAAALGFSVDDAIARLKAWRRETKHEDSHG
jgi:GntR family transcriptional regulator